MLLALGRLHENKAFDVLIRALTLVPGVYLWLAGEGPEREALEALAEKLALMPRIRFLGWRDDAAALFAAADVFVCPSRHEPLGNAVVEAWARNIPVVAARSQGPGALIKDGRNGLLAPVDDGEALARAIRTVLSDADLAARLAAGGYKAFTAAYTEEVAVKKYLKFFKKIMP